MLLQIDNIKIYIRNNNTVVLIAYKNKFYYFSDFFGYWRESTRSHITDRYRLGNEIDELLWDDYIKDFMKWKSY